MFDYERFRNDVLALGLLALVVFIGLSFLSYDSADPPSNLVFPARRTPINICGSTGAAIAFYGRQLLGIGVWVVMAAMVAWDVSLFSREKPRRNWLSLAGTVLLILSSCAALHLALPEFDSGSTYGSGGVLGAWAGLGLESAFSPAGVYILLICSLLSGWMLSPLWAVSTPGIRMATFPVAAFTGVTTAFRTRRQSCDVDQATDTQIALRVNSPRGLDEDEEDPDASFEYEELEDEIPEGEDADAGSGLRINPPVELTVHTPEDHEEFEREYNLPDLDLLEEPEDFPYEALAKKARIAAATLEKTFTQFGLNIRVSEVDTGPAVTQFELDLEPGLRLNKVTALEDDLAIALRVPSVRVRCSNSWQEHRWC